METLLGDLQETNLSLLEGLIYKKTNSVLFKIKEEVFELPYEDAQFMYDQLRPVLAIMSELALT